MKYPSQGEIFHCINELKKSKFVNTKSRNLTILGQLVLSTPCIFSSYCRMLMTYTNRELYPKKPAGQQLAKPRVKTFFSSFIIVQAYASSLRSEYHSCHQCAKLNKSALKCWETDISVLL